jgi:hypothetical protein
VVFALVRGQLPILRKALIAVGLVARKRPLASVLASVARQFRLGDKRREAARLAAHVRLLVQVLLVDVALERALGRVRLAVLFDASVRAHPYVGGVASLGVILAQLLRLEASSAPAHSAHKAMRRGRLERALLERLGLGTGGEWKQIVHVRHCHCRRAACCAIRAIRAIRTRLGGCATVVAGARFLNIGKQSNVHV